MLRFLSANPSPTHFQSQHRIPHRSFANITPAAPKKTKELPPSHPSNLGLYVSMGLPKGVQSPDNVRIALNQLSDNRGAMKPQRRVGRGIGSTKGKTCGRGYNGQNSRSGGGVKPGFEGGTTPLFKRVRKYGFTNEP